MDSEEFQRIIHEQLDKEQAAYLLSDRRERMIRLLIQIPLLLLLLRLGFELIFAARHLSIREGRLVEEVASQNGLSSVYSSPGTFSLVFLILSFFILLVSVYGAYALMRNKTLKQFGRLFKYQVLVFCGSFIVAFFIVCYSHLLNNITASISTIITFGNLIYAILGVSTFFLWCFFGEKQVRRKVKVLRVKSRII